MWNKYYEGNYYKDPDLIEQIQLRRLQGLANTTPVPEPASAPVPDPQPSNPKDILGTNKIPKHLWPSIASDLGALALLDGAEKYGRSNWRAAAVRASIYYDALNRHMDKWFEGENIDADSGLPHLAHALACLGLLVDAITVGTLIDDRQYKGSAVIARMKELTAEVQRIHKIHSDAGHDPIHYTINGGSKK